MDKIFKYTAEEKMKWWDDGEWVNEPDEITFEHQNIKCYIKRIVAIDGFEDKKKEIPFVFGGHFCGYCQLPASHPLYKNNEESIFQKFDIHGGITYSNFDENEHWIGFDCAHAGDYIPSVEKIKKQRPKSIFDLPEAFKKYSLFNPTYKNERYVIKECKSLAKQINNQLNL